MIIVPEEARVIQTCYTVISHKYHDISLSVYIDSICALLAVTIDFMWRNSVCALFDALYLNPLRYKHCENPVICSSLWCFWLCIYILLS